MPSSLKRKSTVPGNSDDETPHSEKKAKTNRSFQDSDDEDGSFEEDEDIELSEGEPAEPNANRAKRTLKELDQITFDKMKITEAGTIARVEVVNFMCHEFLKIDFGPKINFVIGHNGSGKSAILTAITIALGATAHSTNRAKNLGSFIKEGSKAASITIHLTNGGDAPYRPDLYPDFIVIERKIIKDGPSPYKLKNSSGRVISQKKEDLVAILDHMNLMVNNPLTILTQDMARKFLSDSSSEEKYKLFMHGTQLTQLQNDFKGIRESLDTARTIMDRKSQGLPSLETKAIEAQKKKDDFEKVRQLEDKVDLLNNELVWSQIISKEKEAVKFKREAALVHEQMDQMQEAYDVNKKKVDLINESITKVNDDLEDFQNSANPDAVERERLQKLKNDQDAKIFEFKKDLQDINNNIVRHKQQKKSIQAKLQAETDKLESSSRIKRNEITEEIEKMKEKIKEKVGKAKNFRYEQQELDKKISEKNQEKQEINSKIGALDREKNQLVDLARKLEGQRGNSMKAYGQRMPDVLAAIQRETRWKQRRPVGPFGATLQLLESKYTDTLESVLNRQLNSFVVECFDDKKLLFEILQRFKMFVPIVIAEYDIFDYSSGEPDEKYLTCLRALKFNDEWVKRQLIISSKIEKMLLMDDREEADRIMYNKPHNIDLCFTDKGYKVGGKQGMKTESIEKYRGPPRFQKDLESEIRRCQAEERVISQRKAELGEEFQQIQSELNNLYRQKKECSQMERGVEREIRMLEQQVENKEEQLKEDDPVDLAIFEDEIKEIDDLIATKFRQFQDIKTQQSLAMEEAKGYSREIRALDGKEIERQEYAHQFHKKLEQLEGMKRQLQADLDKINLEKQQIKLRYESKYSAYLESERLAKEWTTMAQDDYPERVETGKTPRELEKEISYLQQLAKELEDEAGESFDEIERRAIECSFQWQEASNVVKGMEKLSRSLNNMLGKRIEKWELFRAYISISANHYFSYYLHMRGDEGKLRFNHETKKLDIRVSTGDQYIKGSRQKDSRSLSGGEKSFSQISFLLSLWQSISSPVICLDEFDVFMDAINRKQTMKMIMNAASENSSQYILITPQDASNMEPGPFVTVHRLADPERH